MNDPNGMVYLDGEYHLFYQYYPDSTVWGPMHWGHAVSSDLVNWEELPIALYPDSLGYIFSGSAVWDRENTSGLGTADNPPLVAIFTHHDIDRERAGERNDYEYQSIAYSLDRGRSWTKYAGNPVLPNRNLQPDFRDPKVSWQNGSRQWVMTLAVGDHIEFFGSPDLINWTYLSSFGQEVGGHGGVWECPDLFSLIYPDRLDTLDILLVSINGGAPNGGSGTQYFIGDFDGTTFSQLPVLAEEIAKEGGVWVDYGRDNYAGVTYANLPIEETTFQGWMSNWQYAQEVPTERWRSAMTVARKLQLFNYGGVPRISSTPISGTADSPQRLSAADSSFSLIPNAPASAPENFIGLPAVEVELRFWISGKSEDQLSVAFVGETDRYEIGYDGSRGRYYSNRERAGDNGFSEQFVGTAYGPRLSNSNTLTLRVLLDASSATLFADEGRTVLTELLFPNEVLDRGVIATSESVRYLGGHLSPLGTDTKTKE
jgi:fructan beta-fructosidase